MSTEVTLVAVAERSWGEEIDWVARVVQYVVDEISMGGLQLSQDLGLCTAVPELVVWDQDESVSGLRRYYLPEPVMIARIFAGLLVQHRSRGWLDALNRALQLHDAAGEALQVRGPAGKLHPEAALHWKGLYFYHLEEAVAGMLEHPEYSWWFHVNS